MTDSDVRRIEDKVDDVRIGLARLEGSLSPTLEKLTARQDEAEKVDEDHEKRIRSLEKFRFSFPNVGVIISLLLDAGILVYYWTHPH